MNNIRYLAFCIALAVLTIWRAFSENPDRAMADTPKKDSVSVISFSKQVMPIFHRYCLPCHTEEKMNPSELYLDSYENLMQGGKHGPAVVAGKANDSHLIQKISKHPPFGDPMPFRSHRPFPQDTLRILQQWIDQGGKNN